MRVGDISDGGLGGYTYDDATTAAVAVTPDGDDTLTMIVAVEVLVIDKSGLVGACYGPETFRNI